MVFNFRRQREAPWEVVESKAVSPICMHGSDDEDDLDIVALSDIDTRGTYLFDVKKLNRAALRNAVVFSRQQLMREVEKKNCNMLLFESWRLTILRKGKSHRIEVQYSGKGAHAIGKRPKVPPPPFMDVLEEVL